MSLSNMIHKYKYIILLVIASSIISINVASTGSLFILYITPLNHLLLLSTISIIYAVITR